MKRLLLSLLLVCLLLFYPSSLAAQPSETPYSTTFALARPCRLTQPCQAIITLVSKSGFHLNLAYPTKFTVQDASEGIVFPSLVWDKSHGTWNSDRGDLPLSFQARLPGKNQVHGTLAFSVCSDSTCLVQKIPLILNFAVQ